MDNKHFTEGGNLNLPSGWEVKKLGHILVEGKLGGNYENSESNNGIPVIKMGNIQRSKINLDKVQYLPENETYNEDDILKEGDLLFNTRNTLELVGKVAIWRNELPFALYNSNLMKMKFDAKYVASNWFMNYLFNSFNALSQLRGIATGTTSVAAIYGRDLETIKLLLPPLPEQKAIAQVLSTMDKAIQLTNQLIAQKELRKKWLMQNLLTGKKILRGYDEAWKSVKLGTIGEFSKGSGISKSEILSKGFQCVRYGEIYTVHHTVIQKFNSFINEESVKISKPIYKGDILFAGSGETLEDIGKCVTFLNDVKAYAGGDIIILRLQQNINSLFLAYLLNSDDVTKQKVSMGKGHSVVHIYPKDIAQIEIQLPPIETQTAIAQILQAADKEIELLKAKAEKQKEQKRGMMQVLLTGKKRLTIK